MKITKAVMWAVGTVNLIMAALLILVFFLGEDFVRVHISARLWEWSQSVLIYLLLYWIFILPGSSGFGLGTAIFFLRDQKRIGRFDKSCVALIVLFSLSLAPGVMVLGSMTASMLF